MGCGSQVKIFAIDKTNPNAPTLTLRHTITTGMGSESFGLAFDVADNLYLAAAATGMAAWALPKQVNQHLTPAPSSMTLAGMATGLRGDVTRDGTVDVADINQTINIILGRAVPTVLADVTGDGNIDVADINEIINIILGK